MVTIFSLPGYISISLLHSIHAVLGFFQSDSSPGNSESFASKPLWWGKWSFSLPGRPRRSVLGDNFLFLRGDWLEWAIWFTATNQRPKHFLAVDVRISKCTNSWRQLCATLSLSVGVVFFPYFLVSKICWAWRKSLYTCFREIPFESRTGTQDGTGWHCFHNPPASSHTKILKIIQY